MLVVVSVAAVGWLLLPRRRLQWCCVGWLTPSHITRHHKHVSKQKIKFSTLAVHVVGYQYIYPCWLAPGWLKLRGKAFKYARIIAVIQQSNAVKHSPHHETPSAICHRDKQVKKHVQGGACTDYDQTSHVCGWSRTLDCQISASARIHHRNHRCSLCTFWAALILHKLQNFSRISPHSAFWLAWLSVVWTHINTLSFLPFHVFYAISKFVQTLTKQSNPHDILIYTSDLYLANLKGLGRSNPDHFEDPFLISASFASLAIIIGVHLIKRKVELL